ncbi:Secreted RxLR effector protein 78-like 2 [Homarus americanus]|uniref:Secreted RxLR effector protein 78-like 2 n=1 Tax=Homarus americanus TaxID=6706 RepID=A0A8J5MWH1_HOMAM|nr:Secreted RxLR effector protein 78-like 2 [Homarus americanus]
MANDWWVKKAQEIQAFADVHNTHGFYEAVKSIYGPQRRNVTPVRSLDGPTLYKINQMIATHDGMQARVLVGGVQSEPFSVQMGVKQGCVLSPVLFNIFLLAEAQLSHNALGPDAGVGIRYRLDGNLFNIRRLEAYTKTLTTQAIELQYADDCVIMTHNRESMQRALDVISGLDSIVIYGGIRGITQLINHLIWSNVVNFDGLP